MLTFQDTSRLGFISLNFVFSVVAFCFCVQNSDGLLALLAFIVTWWWDSIGDENLLQWITAAHCWGASRWFNGCNDSIPLIIIDLRHLADITSNHVRQLLRCFCCLKLFHFHWLVKNQVKLRNLFVNFNINRAVPHFFVHYCLKFENMACGINFGYLQILDWDDEGLTIVQAESYFFAWWHQRDVRNCHVISKEVDDTL